MSPVKKPKILRVYAFLKDNGPASSDQVAYALQEPINNIQSLLSAMLISGYASKEKLRLNGQRQRYHYQLTDKPLSEVSLYPTLRELELNAINKQLPSVATFAKRRAQSKLTRPNLETRIREYLLTQPNTNAKQIAKATQATPEACSALLLKLKHLGVVKAKRNDLKTGGVFLTYTLAKLH